MIKTNQTSAPEFPGQRVRVAEREQDRSWLLVNRRVYCQKHGVPAVAARAAMFAPVASRLPLTPKFTTLTFLFVSSGGSTLPTLLPLPLIAAGQP